MQVPKSLLPMTEANALLNDQAALRAQLSEDGYLFFRNIIDYEKIRALREEITKILAEIGWIQGGKDQLDAKAIGLPHREGEEGYFEGLDKIVKLEQLYSLSHDENLMHVMRQVLGDSAFPHPLSITRLVFPNNPEITTPPHQDYPNNQGTPNLTAAWIPLGDCPQQLGTIAVLRGSHKSGLQPLQFHLGPGNRGAIISEELQHLDWVSTDFRSGDILLFPALTMHAALENQDTERMRLSVDFRYQLEGEALTDVCLKPHFNRISWEETYKDWHSTRYQYYWNDKQFTTDAWDSTMHELPEEHLKDASKQLHLYNKAREERHRNNPLRKVLTKESTKYQKLVQAIKHMKQLMHRLS